MASQQPHAKRNTAQLAWLGFALLVHGALLLLPMGGWTEKPRSQPRMTVELVSRLVPRAATVTAPAPAAMAEQADRETESAAPQVPPLPGEPKEVADSSGPSLQPHAPEPETSPEPSPPRLSAAILLHSASQRAARHPETDSARQLGVHTPRDLPANWGRGRGNEELLSRNPEMAVSMAPGEPVILDRWLDTNGDHNVVVTLPSGDTLCGRAQAWDPMQPLVEHIMLFRTCGSGGKRTFDMASRPTPRWETAE
jgi:hypothetical protein